MTTSPVILHVSAGNVGCVLVSHVAPLALLSGKILRWLFLRHHLLSVHCLGYIFLGRLNSKLYVAYAPFTCLLLCFQVASWGGYSFIINLLPIHCLGCIFLGRLNSKLYVAYAPFIILGTIEAASIPVVGFNAVLMSEHFGSFLAFGVLHAAMGMQYIKVGCCLFL